MCLSSLLSFEYNCHKLIHVSSSDKSKATIYIQQQDLEIDATRWIPAQAQVKTLLFNIKYDKNLKFLI